MSRYIYLQCLDHDPPLRAELASGQSLNDLQRARDYIALREQLAHTLDLTGGQIDNYFANNSAIFLAHHRKCKIGIVDEYGVNYSIKEEDHGD